MCFEVLLCFLLDNHSVPVPQDHPHPVTTGTPTRSLKRLLFKEKLTITQSFLQPIPVATVKSLNPTSILDDDDDDDDDDNVSLQLQYVILLCTRASWVAGKLSCV